MKKITALMLALVMLLCMCGTALAADKVSYTLLPFSNSVYEPYIYEGLVGMLKVQKMADVEIEWQPILGSRDEQPALYLAMLASGNYPDIIQAQHNNMYAGGVSQLYADGIIIELNEVIDKYMPNYKALLEAHPEVAKTLKDDQGRYLYFTVINPGSTPDERVAFTWYGLQGRKD